MKFNIQPTVCVTTSLTTVAVVLVCSSSRIPCSCLSVLFEQYFQTHYCEFQQFFNGTPHSCKIELMTERYRKIGFC